MNASDIVWTVYAAVGKLIGFLVSAAFWGFLLLGFLAVLGAAAQH